MFLFLLFSLSTRCLFCEEYFTVTFLYDETKKVVSVKAGDLVPASEIPDLSKNQKKLTIDYITSKIHIIKNCSENCYSVL